MPSWAELQPYYQGDYYAYVETDGEKEAEEEQLKTAAATGELRHAPIKAGIRLLDVGCGEGSFIRLAARLGVIVEGIEPSKLGVAAAWRAGLQVFNGTAEQYVEKHGDERFDVITANHVLEHVHDPVRTLAAMKSLLADDGSIVITVPNAECYVSRSLRGNWHSADLPRHGVQFGKTSIREAGRRAGLRLADLKTYSFPKAVASSLRAWLRWRWLVPGRVTGRIRLIEKMARPVARRMDAHATGEALVACFRHPLPG
jgi:SAM-dependent methyltransferase